MRNHIHYILLASLATVSFATTYYLAPDWLRPRPAVAQIVEEELEPIPAADMLGASELNFTNLADGMSQTTTDGVIRTRAQLSFFDKLQATGLTWYLAISRPDEDRTILWQRVYDEQRFVALKGASIAPTFAQNVTMPAGTYYVSCGVRNDLGQPVAAAVFFARVTQ